MYLNCHSHFSFGYGTESIKDLVTKAQLMGCKSLTLTDINVCSGIFDFITECTAVGIKPLVGVEFRNQHDLKYIAIAQNHEGLFEINAFLSEYLQDKKPFPTKAPSFRNVFVLYPLDFIYAAERIIVTR